MLIIYGVFFILIEKRNEHTRPQVTKLTELTYQMALIIGGFQVLALIPGTSRSGATILGALLIGTSRYVATEFTFYLAIPVMFGASILKVIKFGFHYSIHQQAAPPHAPTDRQVRFHRKRRSAAPAPQIRCV